MKIRITTFLILLFLFATPVFVLHAATRVVIVPGHDDDSPGAVYGGIREADLNAELGAEIFDLLRNDPLFEAHITRTHGGYMPEFAEYFMVFKDAINNYRSIIKAKMAKALTDGTLAKVDGVEHNNVSEDTAVKLYGIGNWAMDNQAALIVHVHFNDIPRASTSVPGPYTGFTIYVPEKQFGNAAASMKAATPIYERLKKYLAVSDMPKETAGIVEDQDLIAIGANDSLTVPSILIEYSYIYEPGVQDPEIRALLFKQLAHETYAGIREFVLGAGHHPADLLLPAKFTKDMKKDPKPNAAVLGLQALLHDNGFYPADGKTLNECPLSGVFGSCTEAAVKAFQKRYGISQLGRVGPATRAKLNALLKK